MNLRRFVLFTIFAVLLSACNFTLAEDVTPPPGYVAPTPLPTLVLSPVQAPSVESGRLIYAEKCAACHGETGLGDGEQGIQLNVTVPAFGLPEIARQASPVGWFTTVTRGRMDRFMPPFSSLNDQERWDVVAYSMTLHMTEEQIEAGKEIFETHCADCSTDFFQDQAKMSALTGTDLARIVRRGNESVPAFGADLSEEEMWAAAAYLRTLSLDYSLDQAEAPASTPEAVSEPETTAMAEAGTPPAEGTEQAAAANEPAAREGFGRVSGSIDNQTGGDLPSGLTVTLRGYDHGTDPSQGPQEVFVQEGRVNEDGSYTFDDIELADRRIYIAEVEVDGIQVRSDFAVAEAGSSSLTLPPIVLHSMTEDTSLLVMDEVRMFLDYSDTEIQVFGVYSFRNPSDKTVVVELKDGQEIPFIKYPEGTTGLGYETLQDSEPFVNTDNGLAIPPSDGFYGLIAFTTVPRQEELEVVQPFVLPVFNLTVFLPQGVILESTRLTDEGLQNIQNFNFQVYTAMNLPAGETIRFNVSGQPEVTAAENTQPTANRNQNLLIGAGVLGFAFILAGAWLYMRDRREVDEEAEEDQKEFESSEDVLDAIVALDDLHRAKKITDAAYQKRRAELKEILKGMM